MNGNNVFALQTTGLTVRRSDRILLDGISFCLQPGESLAITGPSGSGKTLLGEALAGRIFFNGDMEYGSDTGGRVVWVEQQHHFTNLQHTSDLYYQQRYNSYDTEETETVEDSFGEMALAATELFHEMEIGYLRSRRLIQLSNGENKKIQLLKARLQSPTVLILDQPFIGLDVATREWLHRQLNELILRGVLLVIITAPAEIPDSISHVLQLQSGKIQFWGTRGNFLKEVASTAREQTLQMETQWLPVLFAARPADPPGEPLIELLSTNVAYGDKPILQDINWTVRSGERWLLSGPNGAGKSTLLSLITADNPKAYANPITLFGRKRGSGESIWDIKRKIGFVSPELHLYFDQAATAFETVASGLFDTIGLFRGLSDEESLLTEGWMQVCGIASLRNRPLFQLSLGEQRAVLLARCLIKNPPLLILDEPCQGLDPGWTQAFISLIDEVCLKGDKALVFVTHYDNDRPSCITRFLQLEKGRVVSIR